MKRICAGILAHVDAGKTTLTEAMLYTAGCIKKRGRVDRGDSFLDTDPLERARGITIFSKMALLEYGDAVFTLLDTPGHVDFSAETERTLQVLDYAVLVVSATDGVQSHTKTLWKLLRKYGVPVFIFVNKTDLPCPARHALMLELRGKLGEGCVDFTNRDGRFFEDLAVCSEALLEAYDKNGALTDVEIAQGIENRQVFPCMFGSALKSEGVEAFLECLLRYTRMPAYGERFAGRVYKIAADPQGTRLTFLKVTGGTLRVKETPESEKNVAGEKIQTIRLYSGEKFTSVPEAPAGSVAAVTGLTFAVPGDGLGAEHSEVSPMLTPVLSYRVILPEGADTHAALQKLKLLEAEDPTLNVVWDERLGDISLRLMGEVQLEVLQKRIPERFGIPVRFGKGRVVYKETILNTVEGVGHFEPLRHYAEVHLLLQPGERGSGVRFDTNCSEDLLDRNWQRLILTHLYEKTHLGVLTGAPVTDIKITLVSGRAHPKHTEGGDFRQATYRAVRQGLREANSLLLEPVYAFTLELPAELLGRAMADIERLHGSFDPPQNDGVTGTLTGTAPAATFGNYASELAAYTRGLGRLSCVFSGYAPCHNKEEVIAEAAYDPDADTLNPCGSVFCAHGAGYNVPWNEVKAHMHLSAALSERKTGPGPQGFADAPAPAKKADRRDIFAADKELMAIFERTYGPVKDRSDPYAMYRHDRPVKKETPPRPGKPTYTGPEYLLVDGYNVIYSWEELRRLSEESMADARDALIRLLCSYRGYRQNEVILVFDAYRVPGGTREVLRVDGISVVYTKEAETADTYIEITAHELSKNNRVRVVSSDGMEQIIILGGGALRVSGEAFYAEIGEMQRALREWMEN